MSAALKAGQNMSSSPLVQMRGITKRFPGVLANNRIDRPGHALHRGGVSRRHGRAKLFPC
jgi:hypothetical protein